MQQLHKRAHTGSHILLSILLSQERENALRFCQRALQLDPTFEYAYTLCGHEYFANEDFQQGLECYRHATRLNPKHYQAWCASVYCRLLKSYLFSLHVKVTIFFAVWFNRDFPHRVLRVQVVQSPRRCGSQLTLQSFKADADCWRR